MISSLQLRESKVTDQVLLKVTVFLLCQQPLQLTVEPHGGRGTDCQVPLFAPLLRIRAPIFPGFAIDFG